MTDVDGGGGDVSIYPVDSIYAQILKIMDELNSYDNFDKDLADNIGKKLLVGKGRINFIGTFTDVKKVRYCKNLFSPTGFYPGTNIVSFGIDVENYERNELIENFKNMASKSYIVGLYHWEKTDELLDFMEHSSGND